MAKRKQETGQDSVTVSEAGAVEMSGESLTVGEVISLGQPVDLTVDWPGSATVPATPVVEAPDYRDLLRRVVASPDLKSCPICGQRMWAGHLPDCELLKAVQD
jgi:hypothetical protein